MTISGAVGCRRGPILQRFIADHSAARAPAEALRIWPASIGGRQNVELQRFFPLYVTAYCALEHGLLRIPAMRISHCCPAYCAPSPSQSAAEMRSQRFRPACRAASTNRADARTHKPASRLRDPRCTMRHGNRCGFWAVSRPVRSRRPEPRPRRPTEAAAPRPLPPRARLPRPASRQPKRQHRARPAPAPPRHRAARHHRAAQQPYPRAPGNGGGTERPRRHAAYSATHSAPSGPAISASKGGGSVRNPARRHAAHQTGTASPSAAAAPVRTKTTSSGSRFAAAASL